MCSAIYATVQFLIYSHMFRLPLAIIREHIHQYIYNVIKYATNLRMILHGINIERQYIGFPHPTSFEEIWLFHDVLMENILVSNKYRSVRVLC